MRLRLALVFAVLVVGAGPGWAAARPPAPLYQAWLSANEDCRGGAGDDPKTMTACDYRNVIDDKMKAAGWCYGLVGQGRPFMDWHLCGR